jgi:uncharacterized membrane protein YeiH
VGLYLELPTIFLAAFFGAAYFASTHLNVVGVVGVGLLVGLGGGIWRDIVLNIEPAAFQYWYFIPVALIGGILGGVLRNRGEDRWIVVHMRTLTTGMLLLIGLEKAWNYDNPFLSVLAIGILTAVAGTVTASILMQNDLFHHNGGPYLVACLILASVVFLPIADTGWIIGAEVISLLVFVLARLAGERRGWTVPELPWEAPRHTKSESDSGSSPAS